MKIEKLRNSHKKEIIIGTILTVVIGGVLTLRLTHSKYRVTQSIDLGSGVINYIVPDFKIMAMYQQKDGSSCIDDNCYNELTGRMPSSGYIINESKSYCTLDNVNHDTEVILKTIDGNHVVSNLIKGDKCYLYFDKQKLGADQILVNITVKDGTPDFSKIADSDEGVFKAEDGMYGSTNENKIYTYYWRGAATTNHVIFANKCWRIVRINGDKTMRLIYNGSIQSGNTCTGNGANSSAVIMGSSNAEKFYATSDGRDGNSSYVGWTYKLGYQRPSETIEEIEVDSNAKTQTENWYKINIIDKGYDGKVETGKFCNDRNVQSGQSWVSTGSGFNYAGLDRLQNKYQPTLECNSGDTYTLKVGAIAADEAVYAGGKKLNNKLYYLYVGESYWTISPYYWYNSSNRSSMYFIYSDGSLTSASVAVNNVGLRPVINLRSDVTFSSGDGTQNQPYVVS